jgi:two-component system, NarL family, sensor kinase
MQRMLFIGGSTYIYYLSLFFRKVFLFLKSMLKYQKYYLLFIGLLFGLVSCSTEKPKDKIQTSDLCKWLEKSRNYNTPGYQDSFNISYKKFISQNNNEEAGRLLLAYGYMLTERMKFDSLFLEKCKAHNFRYEKSNSNVLKIGLNYVIALQYFSLAKDDSARHYLTKADIKPVTAEEKRYAGYAGIISAQLYTYTDQLDKALDQFLKTLALFESEKDTINAAVIHGGIGSVYLRMKVYDEANKSYLKCIEQSAWVKDTANLLNCYINLARIDELEPQLDTSIKYARKAREIFEPWTGKSDYYEGSVNECNAEVFIATNQLDSAVYYIQLAKEYCKDNPALDQELTFMQAFVDKKKGKPISNIPEIEKSAASFEKGSFNVFQETILQILSDNECSKGNYKKGYELLKQKYALRDSSWMADTKVRLANLDKKYQTVLKEKTIAEQSSKLQKSKFQLSALLLSLIGITLGSLLFFAYRKRKEAQNEMLLQQKFTTDLLQNTEDERKRIATDLHDSVNHELLTLKNQAANGKLPNEQELEKVINEVRQVSRDLYPAMFDNIGLAASIEALCERITDAGLFTTCEINYTLKLSKRNELQLYRIIQEALNNTLKHAKANAAKVTIDTVGNELQVEIKDNGIGFDTEDKMNNATSFGIQSLMQRARAMGGKSSIESDTNGTKLILKTPIH